MQCIKCASLLCPQNILWHQCIRSVSCLPSNLLQFNICLTSYDCLFRQSNNMTWTQYPSPGKLISKWPLIMMISFVTCDTSSTIGFKDCEWSVKIVCYIPKREFSCQRFWNLMLHLFTAFPTVVICEIQVLCLTSSNCEKIDI